MKNTNKATFIFLIINAALTVWGNAQTGEDFMITRKSAGRVELGMTVGEARRIWKDYSFERSGDGEFSGLIAVKYKNELLLTINADEKGYANERSPIQNDAPIRNIEVWDKRFFTKAGVHPQMFLKDAEKLSGKIREISNSPIESREYATFTEQTGFLNFRVTAKGKKAGVNYRKNSSGVNVATVYDPASYILSIEVNENEYTDDLNSIDGVEFSSFYTDLKTDCNAIEPGEGAHTVSYCRGPGKYLIEYGDSATTLAFYATEKNSDERLYLATTDLIYPETNNLIEWRLADGRPFAVIMQIPVMKTGNRLPENKRAEIHDSKRIVRGLYGSGEINYETAMADTIREARDFADNEYSESLIPGRRIEIPAYANKIVFDELITNIGDKVKYVLRAEKGRRMKITIKDKFTESEEGAIMIGSVISPNGETDGNAGGLIFDNILEATGDYVIVISQNRAKSQAINIRFKVEIELEKANVGKD